MTGVVRRVAVVVEVVGSGGARLGVGGLVSVMISSGVSSEEAAAAADARDVGAAADEALAAAKSAFCCRTFLGEVGKEGLGVCGGVGPFTGARTEEDWGCTCCGGCCCNAKGGEVAAAVAVDRTVSSTMGLPTRGGEVCKSSATGG